MNFSDLNIDALNIPVPPNFEGVIGYPGCRKLVALYWAPVVNRLCFEDGYAGGPIRCKGWTAFFEHKSIHPTLEQYGLGSHAQEATHWLLLDRQDRLFYIGDKKNVFHLLKTFIDQIPYHSSTTFKDPYNEWVSSITAGIIVSEPFLEVSEIQKKAKTEMNKIDEMISWLDRNHSTNKQVEDPHE